MSSHSFTSRRRALICAERAETSARICSCRAGSASASLVRSFRYRFFRCSVRLTSRASRSRLVGAELLQGVNALAGKQPCLVRQFLCPDQVIPQRVGHMAPLPVLLLGEYP